MKVHAKRRAARGAAFLDQERPGWFTQINLTRLDIDSCSWCIAAQLSGKYGFTTGCKQLGLGHKKAAKFGMDSNGAGGDEYARLTRAWVKEIMFRREAAELLRSSEKEMVNA